MQPRPDFYRIEWHTWLRCGICGSFFLWLSFSGSQVVIKKSSNDTFFLSQWRLRTKWRHFSENFISLKKNVIWWSFDDDLRAWEHEPEEKGTTNSAPQMLQKSLFSVGWPFCKIKQIDKRQLGTYFYSKWSRVKNFVV